MAQNGEGILSYRRPGSRRGIPARRWIMLSLAVVILWTIYEYHTDAANAFRYFYWKHQWATCTMPGDLVIIDSNVQGPICQSGYETIAPMLTQHPRSREMFPYPDSIPGGTGTVFLHQCISASGRIRIVCVDVGGCDFIHPGGKSRTMQMGLCAYEPHLLQSRAANGWVSFTFPSANPWFIKCPITGRLRLFAGQVDPNDSAHFTIRYDFDGMPGVLNCTLMDDDTIRIVPDRGAGGGPDPSDGWDPTRPAPSGQ
ncbi:MAG: hypothetical protein JWN51_2870 [Phycisphaerales bacterium]|nr:hypothetical protein [Phycisphaerales bacterium]